VGKIRMQIDNMPIDFLSVSGHKFHGPQGIGVIYAKAPKSLYPILWGGPQEFGMRPGTENLPGIVGIGKAAELRSKRFDTVTNRVQELRDIFELSVLRLVPNVEVNGDRTRRVHNTTNLLFRDIEGQALVARLDQLGIRCSQSSACTNQIPEPSYVLRSMGLSYDEAFSSIRFSLSEYTTRQEIDYTVEQIKEICSALSDFSLNKIPKLMAEQR
jgi:cysteine desulfurase